MVGGVGGGGFQCLIRSDGSDGAADCRTKTSATLAFSAWLFIFSGRPFVLKTRSMAIVKSRAGRREKGRDGCT